MISIQIVGYKNSGKTTLVSQLVKRFSNNHWKVATLKHHGHGGEPSSVPNTDSEIHRQAGAIIAGVEGDGNLQLSIQQDNWDIKQIMNFYQLIDIDLLLIEGYKQLDFNKIVLIRDEDDLELLAQLTNVKAVVSDVKIKEEGKQYSIFYNWVELTEWIEKNMDLFKKVKPES